MEERVEMEMERNTRMNAENENVSSLSEMLSSRLTNELSITAHSSLLSRRRVPSPTSSMLDYSRLKATTTKNSECITSILQHLPDILP